MHPNEAFLKNLYRTVDPTALMLEAIELGPKYVEALQEQFERLGLSVPA